MDSTLREEPGTARTEECVASVINRALEASMDLLSRLEESAQDFARYLARVKAGTVSEGEPLFPLFEMAGEGPISTLLERLERRGAMASAEVVEPLLTLSEIVGLEDPHLGRELAGAAMVAATCAETTEELLARSRMVYGSWIRMSGPPVDLFAQVIAQNLQSESHEQELGRRFAYVLGDVGQAEGACMSVSLAWSFQGSDPHMKGRVAEAMAHACARKNDMPAAMTWHVRALGLLDPAAEWPVAWQAALNTVHHIGDWLHVQRVASWDPSEIEAYASILEACSPFDPSSPPSLALKWGLGRVLSRSSDTQRARALLNEASVGFSSKKLRQEWWGSCSDLAILDLADERPNEAMSTVCALLADGDAGDAAQWRRLVQLLQKLGLEPKSPTVGLSLCSLLT